MNSEEIRSAIFQTLKSIAPEVEENEIQPDRLLREQVDLDSMDWLNFLLGLHQRLKVEIPEADYRKLTTVNTLVAYLAAKGV